MIMTLASSRGMVVLSRVGCSTAPPEGMRSGAWLAPKFTRQDHLLGHSPWRLTTLGLGTRVFWPEVVLGEAVDYYE